MALLQSADISGTELQVYTVYMHMEITCTTGTACGSKISWFILEV